MASGCHPRAQYSPPITIGVSFGRRVLYRELTCVTLTASSAARAASAPLVGRKRPLHAAQPRQIRDPTVAQALFARVMGQVPESDLVT